MTGENWSPVLLLVASALALTIAPVKFRWSAALALVVSAGVAAQLTYREDWQPMMLAGSWISIILTSLAVYRTQDASPLPSLALALNAGSWVGAVTTIGDNDWDLVRVMPFVLLLFPAAWIVARTASIVLKVLASWLITIAIMVLTLPIVTTPGYAPDHME